MPKLEITPMHNVPFSTWFDLDDNKCYNGHIVNDESDETHNMCYTIKENNPALNLDYVKIDLTYQGKHYWTKFFLYPNNNHQVQIGPFKLGVKALLFKEHDGKKYFSVVYHDLVFNGKK